ncbi:MAG: hypothetical protein H0X37_02295 [Herpetosiphonaceae bacterium]|nr:hypothetical protein [Herpetosiphonaceae bacterium]
MTTKRSHGWRWIVVGLSLMLCLSGLLGAAPAFAASSSLDRIQASADQTLTLQATGLDANESVSTWASSARGSVYPTAGGQTNGSGNVTLTIQLGRFWEPGWWAITIHGRTSGREAVTTFELQAAAPDGALDISATSVTAGSTINFHGTGFRDGEIISVWATRPDGSAVALVTAVHSTGGQIYFSYTVPAGSAAGTWSMTAYGNSGGHFLIRSFTVTG